MDKTFVRLHAFPLDSAQTLFESGCTMINQIKFVTIPVRDQKRALDFYTEKLGFTIITDQPFDGKQRWIELRIPKAETRITLFTPEGQEGRRRAERRRRCNAYRSASTLQQRTPAA